MKTRLVSKLAGGLGPLLALVLIAALVAPALAVSASDEPPSIPHDHQFWGSVQIGETLAEPGTVVTAKIDGVADEWTSTVVDIEGYDGYYGLNAPPDYPDNLLLVPADDPNTTEKDGGVEGDTVKFYVLDKLAGQALFVPDETTELPLTIPDLTDLDAAITSAQALVETDYTAGSWAVLDTALTAALVVQADPAATQAEVEAATTAINDAIGALVFAGQADLDAAIIAAEAKVETDYTGGSWADLVTALAMDETTNAEVVTKTTAINDAIAALEFAGKADLDAAEDAAALLDAADYTEASWAALVTALAMDETTNAEVEAKTTAINDAIGALVDLTDLGAAITEADLLVAADYTEASWAALQTELTAALAVQADPAATQVAVDAAVSALDGAILALVDLTDLQGKIAEAGLLDEADYTTNSWTALQTELTAANVILIKADATQAEVDAAVSALTDAIGALVAVSDLTAYNAALAAVTEADYTTPSWATYQGVVGDNVMTTDNTQAEVDAATAAITAAQGDLVAVSDLTAYNAALAAVTEADYTTPSWATYQLVVADNVVTTDNTQAEVDAATAAITAAQGDLVFAGKADLDAAEDAAALLDAADYTEASWAALVTALAMDETTNDEVVAKTTAINAAIDALVAEAGDLTDYNAALAAVTEADYTPTSWTTYQLVVADNVVTDANLQSEIDAATEAITAAQGDLVAVSDLTAYNAALAAVTEADYTPTSWTTYQGVVGDNVMTTDNTQAEVDAATAAITAAQGDLVFAGKADLDAAEDAAALLDAADYTEASWAALVTALAMDETTNDEVVAKTTAINDAIDALVFAGQADLDTAVAAAGALVEADYTAGSWADLETALALPETTNAEVEAKTTAIDAAIAALVFAGQADLDAAEDAAALLDAADYTEASWAALVTALALPETTNAEVEAKTTAIDAAIAALVFAGQADLDTAVAAAGALVEADYTAGSWAALVTALALPETTNAEVEAKTTAINDAIAALAIQTFTITATAGEGGSISPSGAVVVDYGAEQLFTITPNEGYEIAEVLIDGASIPDVPHLVRFENVTYDRTIHATFAVTITHELTMLVVGEGTVSPETGTYPEGEMAITATIPVSGWEFAGWSTTDMAEIADPTSAETTLTLDKDKTVTATFTEVVTYDLTVASTDGGSVTSPVEGTSTHNAGTVVNLVAVPEEDYTFGWWSGDVVADVNAASTTITMDSAKSIVANFVEFSAPENVSVTEIDPGVESVTVTIEPVEELDVTEMPAGMDPQEAYVVEPTGTGSFTLIFTVPNASDIRVYKVVDGTWTLLEVTVVDATTIKVTMEVADPILVFALPPPIISTTTLPAGWNLLSTPIKLDADSDSLEQILGESVANIEASYRWDGPSQQWEIPTGYELSPLEAVYVRVKADASATAEFIPSGEVSELPSRELQRGLNLIGPAPALAEGAFPAIPLDRALVSIEQASGGLRGYTMVVSPAHNQPDWAYGLGGTVQNLLPYNGYWVVMENADTLFGFSTTPAP